MARKYGLLDSILKKGNLTEKKILYVMLDLVKVLKLKKYYQSLLICITEGHKSLGYSLY